MRGRRSAQDQPSSCAACALSLFLSLATSSAASSDESSPLNWTQLPDLPEPLGFAGALSGGCDDKLVFAGGSNFPFPTWTSTKHFDDRVWTLGGDISWTWELSSVVLPAPTAYAACGSISGQVVCAGGQTPDGIINNTFAIPCDLTALRPLPSMPVPTAFASSAVLGGELWVLGGDTGTGPNATTNVWVLDAQLSQWRAGPPLPTARKLSLAVVHANSLYMMSGRRQDEGRKPEFLKDCWQLNDSAHVESASLRTPRHSLQMWPSRSEAAWERCASLPAVVMAGTVGVLNNRIFTMGGDDGAHFGMVSPDNPGYPKMAYVYDSYEDAWSSAGSTPEGFVTTTAIPWQDGLVLNGGEVKPRVRTNHTWLVRSIEVPTRRRRRQRWTLWRRRVRSAVEPGSHKAGFNAHGSY